MTQAAPRRVLFFLPDLTAGGAQRVILTVLRHLDRSRFEPALAVIARGPLEADLPDDIRVFDLGRIRWAIPRLVGVVREFRPATVVSTLGPYNLALLALRPFLGGARIVVREANTVSEKLRSTWRHPWFWRAAYRRLYPHADLVICQSRAMLDDLDRNFGVPGSRLRVIYNPVDVTRIRASVGASPFADGAPRVVAVGKLSRQKGFDLLIEAWATIAADVAPARLTIVGGGGEAGALERLAEEAGVADSVELVGQRPDAWSYIAHSRIFVLSSRYEGLPNVLLEALALRRPVLAVDGPGGTREVMEEAGLLDALVPADALAESLRAALDADSPDPTDVPESFQVENVVRRFEEVL